MKGYKNVAWTRSHRPFDILEQGTPVAIEVFESSEPLTTFDHPDDAIYLFGPEDGSIGQVWRRFCHRFVHIPSRHCLNLSGAVNVILSDRMMKSQREGRMPILPIGEMLNETRGFIDVPGWEGK